MFATREGTTGLPHGPSVELCLCHPTDLRRGDFLRSWLSSCPGIRHLRMTQHSRSLSCSVTARLRQDRRGALGHHSQLHSYEARDEQVSFEARVQPPFEFTITLRQDVGANGGIWLSDCLPPASSGSDHGSTLNLSRQFEGGATKWGLRPLLCTEAATIY
jgi:hypothetical protein